MKTQTKHIPSHFHWYPSFEFELADLGTRRTEVMGMSEKVSQLSVDEMERDGFREKLVSATAVVSMVISAAWYAFSRYFGVPIADTLSIVMFFSAAAPLVLGHFGLKLLGALVWFGGGIAVVTYAVFQCPPEAGAEALFAAVFGGPFLCFSMETQRRYVFGLSGIAILAWLSTRVLGADFFGPPVISGEMALQYIAPAVYPTVILLVGFEMMGFAFLTNRHHRSLAIATEAARAASKAKSQFLAAMSHEIRTPMNGVMGMTEILSCTDLTQDQRRHLHTIRESSVSLLAIIEDILDMSRIEAGKLELNLETHDLYDVLDGSADSLRSFADNKNVITCLQISPEVPRKVITDAGRLRQIVINLMGNAIKFSRRPDDEGPGFVMLNATMPEPNQLKLVFTDDGIGIDPDFQKLLFEPFQQSEAVNKRRFGGSGLGLAIVAQLLEKMGGSISVESALGEGACFTVLLPVEPVQAGAKVPSAVLHDYHVVLVGMEGKQKSLWQPWLERSGARIDFAKLQDLAADPKLYAEADALIINGLGMTQDNLVENHSAVWRDYPHRRVFVMTTERSAPAARNAPNLFYLQASPLLNADLRWTLDTIARSRASEKMPAPKKGTTDRLILLQPKRRAQILVAEDNEINQMVLATQLERIGHDATIVGNGRAALEEWKRHHFDIVLSDCHMPEMDGFELTAAIRACERDSKSGHTPIVAITANAQRSEADHCLMMGMDDYLSKPLSVVDLARVIDRFF